MLIEAARAQRRPPNPARGGPRAHTCDPEHVLNVLSVAYPLAPVGPGAVGGAEQVLAALDEALVAAGHRSIVIACAGSKVAGELVSLPAVDGPVTREAWGAAHASCRAAIRRVLEREPIDLVHMHGVDFHAYLPPPGPAVLATLHLPPECYPPGALRPARPRTYLQCVSRTQRLRCPPGARLLDEIENGVDLAALRPRGAPGEYALVLGRICPEKGPHLALEAGARAGVAVVLAGKVFGFPEHTAYFRTEVEPRLVPPHRFVGVVEGQAKARLVAEARCVVVPSTVHETSSLAAMEALACGTPVIGLRRGALVELVDDGVTGWLVDDVEGLARAIRDAGGLDRARCRAIAEARCSRARMCERHLARYRELAAAPGAAPASRPSAHGSSGPARRGAAGSAGRLHVEVLGLEELAAAEEAWSELWARCPDATCFQRPEWCLPWCRHLLAGRVEALAAWRGGRLEALLPLFRWRDGEADVLSAIGAGVSDYQDLLAAPDGGGGAATAALAGALAELAWDRVELSELREGSALAALPLPSDEERVDQEPCPALPLPPGAPLGAVPAGMAREIAYQRRRAAREVGLEAAPLPAAELVEALAALHRARWAARGQAGVLDDARRAFLADAVARLAARDAVLGVGVRLGGAPAAIALGLVDREAVRYYLGGLDPAHARHSPGTLAIAAAIEEAGRRGARWFDFLRGGEPYKYRLGARDRVRLVRRVVRRPGGPARGVHGVGTCGS